MELLTFQTLPGGETRPKITIECFGWTFLTNMQW